MHTFWPNSPGLTMTCSLTSASVCPRRIVLNSFVLRKRMTLSTVMLTTFSRAADLRNCHGTRTTNSPNFPVDLFTLKFNCTSILLKYHLFIHLQSIRLTGVNFCLRISIMKTFLGALFLNLWSLELFTPSYGWIQLNWLLCLVRFLFFNLLHTS